MGVDSLPLLTTDQMASFVARGFLRLDAVVPPDVNAQAMDELPHLFRSWLDEFRGATAHDDGTDGDDGDEVPLPRSGTELADAYAPGSAFGRMVRVPAVAGAIADHMGLWRDEPLLILEAQVLWDADKLAKIGLTAVFHWTGGRLAGDEMRTLADLIARGRDADWQSKTVASMHTEPARRAAATRLAAYHALYDALERELAGDDLVTSVS